MRTRDAVSTTALVLATLSLVRCAEDRAAAPAPESSDAATDDGALDARVAIDAGARTKCAERSPARCLGCAEGEECFTQVSCGLVQEGGLQCVLVETDAEADDSCHRGCARDTDCPAGERCLRVQYFGCVDFNGGAMGKGLCCRDGECR